MATKSPLYPGDDRTAPFLPHSPVFSLPSSTGDTHQLPWVSSDLITDAAMSSLCWCLRLWHGGVAVVGPTGRSLGHWGPCPLWNPCVRYCEISLVIIKRAWGLICCELPSLAMAMSPFRRLSIELSWQELCIKPSLLVIVMEFDQHCLRASPEPPFDLR